MGWASRRTGVVMQRVGRRVDRRGRGRSTCSGEER